MKPRLFGRAGWAGGREGQLEGVRGPRGAERESPREREGGKEETDPSAEGSHCRTRTFCTPHFLSAMAEYLTME